MTSKIKKFKIYNSIITRFLLIGIAIFLLIGCIQKNDFNTYEGTVIDDHDDARTFTVEFNEAGYGDEDGSWATLQLSPSYSFGVRFVDVDIPKDAIIRNATVSLYSTGTPGHSHPNCLIYCDNTSFSVNFTECGVLDICGRNYTYNYVLWNMTVPHGEWVLTPSLVGPIQEVINRDDWKKNSNLEFIYRSNT